ncbi:MAG: nucleotidyltransferase domain-containing protein [Sulfurovum sp.]|nr:nucleotidyltransferase domain-containing protein [Sulfurovum sp.]
MQMQALKDVLGTFDYIEFALLFGSAVEGRQQVFSDVDIAVHTNRPIDLLEQGYLVSTLEEVVKKPVDLVLLNDLYKHYPKLAFNIVDKHNVILNKHQEKYTDFKTNTYKYYFDHQPMYAMFDESLRKRIANGTYGKAQAS